MVGEVLVIIKELANKQLTMMIVTHEMKFARKVADHDWFVDDGIIHEKNSSGELCEHPQEAKIQDFTTKSLLI